MFKGTVISFLRSIREKACGNLSVTEVIAYAIAANALSGAWFISAIAMGQVRIFFAVHSFFYKKLQIFFHVLFSSTHQQVKPIMQINIAIAGVNVEIKHI